MYYIIKLVKPCHSITTSIFFSTYQFDNRDLLYMKIAASS